MLKEKRQQKIRSLIQAKNIGTQEELTNLLSRAALSVTQSSVSRDLEEMGVVKIKGFYALTQANRDSERFGLLGMETAGDNLIIAKTEPGLASAIALRIDRAKVADIVGTVAGDDTIFIAVKDAKAQRRAIKNISETFEKLF